MEREIININDRGNGNFIFYDNVQINFYKKDVDYQDNFIELNDLKVTVGNNCWVKCGERCEINAGDNCKIRCEYGSLVKCGNNCDIKIKDNTLIKCGDNCFINIVGFSNKIDCGEKCNVNGVYLNTLIKGKKNTKINLSTHISNEEKIIELNEEFIWWEIIMEFSKLIKGNRKRVINTYEDENWKKNNSDRYKDLYGFVHDELDLATLF